MQLYTRDTGGGTPLVLLHGIGHRWQAWEPVLDRLALHHDVIAFFRQLREDAIVTFM